jgi:predicted AAA+ superfamily ATPase
MLASRINQQLIEFSLNRPFITGILGPRRVGKSTLVQDFVQNKTPCCQINLDLFMEQQAIKDQGLRAFIEKKIDHKLGKAKIWVTIDEAQKYPGIFDEVKALYDEFKGKELIKFIITGSSQLEIHKLSAESLAGRIELFHLHEFSLQETVNLTGTKLPYCSIFDLIIDQRFEELEKTIAKLQPFQQLLSEALQLQLSWGGLPEVLTVTSDRERLLYLANYLQTYLEKDVRINSRIDIPTYQKLLEVSAEQTASLRDDKKLIDSLGIARETLKKYRDYLSATLLYEEVYPFIHNSLKRMVKSPKIYLLNNGLLSYLMRMTDFNLLVKTGLIGQRLENWFLKELNIAKARQVGKTDIYFWRTHSGAEIDFVLSAKPHIYPFEVTYKKTIDSKKLRNLQTFMREEKAEVGFYIYNGEFHHDQKTNIYYIPAFAVG